MTAATHDLTDLLERKGIHFEVLPHRRTETASDEAAALGVDPHEVAKTVVLVTEHGYVRALVPASDRLDLCKARAVLHLDERPELAHEADLAVAYPSFELGAVPPVGGPGGDRVAVDSRLARRETIVIEGASHEESLRVRTEELLVLAHAAIGDLCHD